jgi:hypothetical protein
MRWLQIKHTSSNHDKEVVLAISVTAHAHGKI